MFKIAKEIYEAAKQEPGFDEKGFCRNKTRMELITETIGQLWAMGVCKVFGHDYIDNDPGDPEVGPQPDVYCSRCGRSPIRK